MTRPHRARSTLSCASVREEISAALDGEPIRARGRARRRHLELCADCRRFVAEVGTLTRQMSLEASHRAPDALKDLLAAELVRTGPEAVDSSHRSSWFNRTDQWRRRVQWVAVLAPAATLAVVVPLGPLSTPEGTPTHPSTPCTAHLRAAMPSDRIRR
jgi:negative regulator of sigma E activity